MCFEAKSETTDFSPYHHRADATQKHMTVFGGFFLQRAGLHLRPDRRDAGLLLMAAAGLCTLADSWMPCHVVSEDLKASQERF